MLTVMYLVKDSRCLARITPVVIPGNRHLSVYIIFLLKITMCATNEVNQTLLLIVQSQHV